VTDKISAQSLCKSYIILYSILLQMSEPLYIAENCQFISSLYLAWWAPKIDGSR